jgi:hypothetical protein
VVRDVEVSVIDPHRLVDPEGHLLQALPEQWEKLEAGLEHPNQASEVQGLLRDVEDAQATDVTSGDVCLESEEGGVEARQALHETRP